MREKAMFKQIFYQSSVPQLIGSIDFKRIEMNDAFYEYIGYSKEEFSNMTIPEISYPEDLLLDQQLFSELINRQRKKYQMEKRYIHKSGEIIWGMLHVSLIDVEDVSFVHGQIMDITEKKLIEDTYRINEKKYRILAENSSDMIIMHDVDGTYLYVSPSVESILGYEPDQIIGLSPYMFMHQDDIRKIKEQHMQASQKKETVIMTYRARTKSGNYIWIESAVKPVLHEITGEMTELISVSRNIQQRLETDSLIRKSEKLAVAGQLAAAVAHEIRNPLTSIKGFIQLFHASNESCSPEYTGLVLDELKRVEEIISEFLTMAKPHQEVMKQINISAVVTQVVQLLKTQALLDNKEIILEIYDRLPLVIGDSSLLKQVFINIIQNALEASKADGYVQVLVHSHDDEIAIIIRDQGIGISKERLLKLGEPFYSTKEKGTGLGLMTCYRIIEQHNGKIKIQSEEGEGTTVTIFLPMNK
ncbi:PAS domain-containing sensor histidine kinase [Bacillus suaedaesalsae]|uniref:histidine kinase n=1 Tax=Bacillus suaedaesalsae TaxID=2810349 RepID=A0ABS2DMT9_9BACI|nr:PAS domain-containing sensor histidine kinase [Bacillus suaedaesalsae]MBM6618793.1 PAS domain S-box protein [Bacillus suaedaesalsae]